MQTIEVFTTACRSYAEHAYALPDLVDVSHNLLELDFEDGRSPEQAVDTIATSLGLIHRDKWDFTQGAALMARIVPAVRVTPTLTLVKR